MLISQTVQHCYRVDKHTKKQTHTRTPTDNTENNTTFATLSFAGGEYIKDTVLEEQ